MLVYNTSDNAIDTVIALQICEHPKVEITIYTINAYTYLELEVLRRLWSPGSLG